MTSTNGWQNYGSYMQHVDDNENNLTPIEYRLLALLVRESFGRTQLTTSISNKDLQLKSNSSDKTVSKAIGSLIEKKWIKRITGQGYGPKTKYTYAVEFINGIYIKTGEPDNEKQPIKKHILPNGGHGEKGW